MSAGFHVHLDDGVVVVTHVGHLRFEQTNQALRAAVEAAEVAHAKRLLLDHRQADTANYYNYVVRHAELAPQLGLDLTYRLAFLGLASQVAVLDFICTVTRNRGWKSRSFTDREKALAWLRGRDPDGPSASALHG